VAGDTPDEPRSSKDAVAHGVLGPMRLQRFLARSGVASRRGSEDLMTAGRVRVNGVVVTSLGSKVDPRGDVIEVDGERVVPAGAPVYLLLNKPAGYVTTMSDPQGRPTVSSLVPVDRYPGLFPVGRLDLETTGLLLFTTDGELSHRLLHPRWKVPKTYVAVVEGNLGPRARSALESGVELDDGMTAPAVVRVLESRPSSALVEITIREGRKRQVRRMFSAVGHPVAQLHRTVFGPVELGTLEPSSWRMLDDGEIAALREATEMGV
jgi:23S rRNA pseudouridine2605 synthase